MSTSFRGCPGSPALHRSLPIGTVVKLVSGRLALVVVQDDANLPQPGVHMVFYA